MPASTHMQADVLAKLLVNASLCSAVDADGVPEGSWPVYARVEPDTPDDVVTIYNTEGFGGVRDFITGAPGGPLGFQLRVRGATSQSAQDKINAIYEYLSETLYRQGVSIGSRYYLVHACERFGDVIDLGSALPDSHRSVYVFNAFVEMKEQTP